MNLKDLSPNLKNPRKISDKKLEMLKKSLAKFGDLSGFVFNRRSKTLISGHQRQKALTEGVIKIQKEYSEPTKARTVAEGYVTIEGERFKYREVDADAQWESEAMLAANKHGGEWDEQLLKAIFSENINIELAGFELPELAAIEIEPAPYEPSLEEPTKEDGLTNEDDVPEIGLEEPRTRSGDLYQLGEHRLLCGDSTKREDVERLMNGEKADMVFTDPPYGISVVKKNGNVGGAIAGKWGAKANCQVFRDVIGDDKPFEPAHLLSLAEKHIIFGANNFASKLPDNSHWICWDKAIPKGNDFSDCELAWTSYPGKTIATYRFTWAGMTGEGSRKDELNKRIHPCQKPVGLFEAIIMDYNPASVIDCYLGSGSTLIACEKTNRRCYGMEIDPNYCDVIVDRWEKYTGKKAVLLTE